MANLNTEEQAGGDRAGDLDGLVAAVESEDSSMPRHAMDRARRLVAFVAHAESIAWPEEAASKGDDQVLIDLTAASIASTDPAQESQALIR